MTLSRANGPPLEVTWAPLVRSTGDVAAFRQGPGHGWVEWRPQASASSPPRGLYDPATGTWTSTGTMVSRREEHTATLLPSGLVLVAGGLNVLTVTTTLSSSELYDPATETWTSTGAMVSGREEHTATLLPSGKVLVTGGSADKQSLASAEVYDPKPGTWASANSLASARVNHVATLLPSGKVLVTGGFAARAEPRQRGSVRPGTGAWAARAARASAAGRIPRRCCLPARSWSPVDAMTAADLASAEVYEPVADTWFPTRR